MTDELTAEQLEQLLQMVMLPQPPYLMAGVGLTIYLTNAEAVNALFS